MDNQFFEELLGLTQLKVTLVELEKKTIHVKCEQKVHKGPCPLCGKTREEVHQYSTHEVRDLDISGRKVILVIRVAQLVCQDCHRYFNEPLDFVEPNKSYTKRQAKWVFEMSAKQPLTEVGALIDMHAKTVERIFYQYASATNHDRYAGVKRLGIDEISFRKGKGDYLCVLTDLDSGNTIDILRDRKKESLIAHLKEITRKGSPFCEQIQAVSCDFWGPFMDVAKTMFPNAIVVGDRFHWTQYLNEALNKLRRFLRKEQPKAEIFKSIKWALFKQQSKINSEQKLQLAKAFELSPVLKEMYDLKNALQDIFETDLSYEQAVEKVREWMGKALALNQEYLSEFVAFLERQFEPIVNFFKQKISNAKTEGNNNLLRTVKRMAFNMTNFAHFKARTFAFKT
jgi:transposase